MKSIQTLFDKVEHLKYPETMKCVKGEIKRIAFFPGGKGTFDMTKDLSGKNIMILGQDFDCEKNYNKSLENGTEDIQKNPTWRNLIAFLKNVNIEPTDCFFTNAIMGIRKGNIGTGKSPAFKDKTYLEECRNFFLSQLELQKPKAIFVLGKYVAEFLSPMSDDLSNWKTIKNFVSIDSQNLAVVKNVNFKNNVKTNLVLLTHPSFRPSNIERRSYKNLSGNEAEMLMINEIK